MAKITKDSKREPTPTDCQHDQCPMWDIGGNGETHYAVCYGGFTSFEMCVKALDRKAMKRGKEPRK